MNSNVVACGSTWKTTCTHIAVHERMQWAFTFCGLLLHAEHGLETDAVFVCVLCANYKADVVQTQLISPTLQLKQKPQTHTPGTSAAPSNKSSPDVAMKRLHVSQQRN